MHSVAKFIHSITNSAFTLLGMSETPKGLQYIRIADFPPSLRGRELVTSATYFAL